MDLQRETGLPPVVGIKDRTRAESGSQLLQGDALGKSSSEAKICSATESGSLDPLVLGEHPEPTTGLSDFLMCDICKSSFGEVIQYCWNGHLAHIGCIQKWALTRPNCPSCKGSISHRDVVIDSKESPDGKNPLPRNVQRLVYRREQSEQKDAIEVKEKQVKEESSSWFSFGEVLLGAVIGVTVFLLTRETRKNKNEE